MQQIDRTKWNREEIFRMFSQQSNPFYMVTFTTDVTEAVRFCKREQLSFYHTLVWLITNAVNRVENFRYRIQGEKVFLVDRREPSFTDLPPGSDLFHIVTMQAGDDLRDFCRRAAKQNAEQTCFLDLEAEAGDLIYFSCLPWVNLTALTNERDLNAPDAKNDSVPRIAWGRYTERDGRCTLGLSLEVNHRLIDGLHIGRFAEALQSELDALREQ